MTTEYKQSRVSWIGKIPVDWRSVRIKNIFHGISNGSTLTQVDDITDYPVSRIETISTGEINLSKVGYVEGHESLERFKLNKGDFLLSHINSYEYIGNSAEVKINNLYHGMNLLRLQPDHNRVLSSFVYYYLKSNLFKNAIQMISKPAINQVSVPITGFKNLRFPLPSKEEQGRIVNYLDEKVGRVRELVADKERLIELLEEQKQTLVHEAVTRGLDPEAPTKPTNLPWLDQIPAHWNVKKISWIFNLIGSGTTPTATNKNYYTDGKYPWINTGDLNDGYLHDCQKRVNEIALESYSSLKKYPKNALIIALYGATIGKLAITKFKATVNQACCVMADSVENIQFLFYWFLANRPNIINLSYGGGQPNISQDIVKGLRVALPPLPEQQAIVEHIERETSKIDELIATARREIELVREYEASLIYHVVTGKVRV